MLDEKGIPHIAIANSAKFYVITETPGVDLFKGNLEYISPELFLTQPITVAHDYWCLGIMLYEMLFGPTPFESDNKKKTQLFIEHLEVVFPESIPVSEDTKDIILKLLEKDPKKRLKHFPEGLSTDPWFISKDKLADDLKEDLLLCPEDQTTYFYQEHTKLDPKIDYFTYEAPKDTSSSQK